MWGGYSQAGVEKLQELATCPYISNDLRALACYELARFFADTDRPFTASNMMSDARTLSKPYMRGTRQRVLEYELLLETADTETALRRIREYIKFRPNDPNFRIGLANYFYKHDDLAGQLSAINDLFDAEGMTPIRVDDPDEPFLSLASAVAPTYVEDGPKVSVFMSCYNSAEYLRLAVGSMQAQTWRNLEIIITDDCSTDESLEILKELAAEDPRLVIVENTENHGTYGNRNRMLEICTGDYVTVHDSDDWSHPQMIEHQMAHLVAKPDVRLNTTLMCRVSQDLKFHIRPSRASLEYCHMNYPGFLMRTEDVKALTRGDAVDIFIRHYFVDPGIARLPEALQPSLFDMYVNAGSNAVRILQKLLCKMGLSVAVDGVIGPQTAAAAEAAARKAPDHIADAYGIERRNYYYSLADRRSASRKYARRRDGGKGGWITRAEEFISPQYHLSEAAHRARVAKWG